MKKFILIFFCIFSINNIAFSSNNDLFLQQRLEDIKLQQEIKNAEDFGKNRDITKIETSVEKDIKQTENKDCFKISEVEVFNEIKKLKTKTIQKKINKKYKNQCFNKENLEKIRNEVNQFYIKKGYSTTIVGFDIKSLENKKVKLIVKEQYVKDIKIENDKFSKLKTFFLFPFVKNKVFNLRDVEQGLDQFNRLNSNNSTIDILDNEVIIKNNKTKIFGFDLNYNNHGSDTNGVDQYNISFNLDNPLLINDNFYINYTDTLTNHKNKYSKSLYLSYSIPFGYWTYSTSYSNSQYYNTVIGITNTIINYSGNTDNYSHSLDKVLYRNNFYKLNSIFEFELIDKTSKIRETIIDNSTFRISNVKFSLNNTFNINNGILIIKPTFQQGTNLLNSDKDKTYKNDGIAKNDYELYKLFIYFNKYIPLLKSFYLFQFNGQYTAKTLYSSNQISIGGVGTLRAFKDISLSGDKGFSIKNELSTYLENIKYINKISTNKLFSKIKLGIFFEYGLVSDKYHDHNDIYNSTTGQLADIGLNLKYSGKYLDYSFIYAKSIYASKFVETKYNNNRLEDAFWFSLSAKF